MALGAAAIDRLDLGADDAVENLRACARGSRSAMDPSPKGGTITHLRLAASDAVKP